MLQHKVRGLSSWYLVFTSWGNSKNSMWLSFGVSSRYLCVYFQEIGKTQHLLIRSAICHTVRRLHSAPRSLRCMCKWVVLEITKHRLGGLFGVHLAPIVITYSEPWSFLNLELRYPERLVFERNSSRTLLLRALSSTHTIDIWLSTIHICELHDGVESRVGVVYLPPLSRWRLYDRKGLSVWG